MSSRDQAGASWVRRALAPQQRVQALDAREPVGDRQVLRGALLDAGLQQREQQIRLARELGVHDALGEARLVGDRLQRRAGVPALEEHPSCRLEHETAVALHLLGPGQPCRHASD